MSFASKLNPWSVKAVDKKKEQPISAAMKRNSAPLKGESASLVTDSKVVELSPGAAQIVEQLKRLQKQDD